MCKSGSQPIRPWLPYLGLKPGKADDEIHVQLPPRIAGPS